MKKFAETLNLKSSKLQDDYIFNPVALRSVSEVTQFPTRKGLDNFVVSNGEIVNVVSKSYGLLPNTDFFMEVERKLIEADVNYIKRSINRENRSFAVDYILNDDRYIVNVKNGIDKIKPMLRFVNSYDGSCKTTGNFGFFREVCSNGLHVANLKIGFKTKHTGDIVSFVLPEIKTLVNTFLSNEYYELRLKFETMAERPIINVNEWVKLTAEKFNLFQFESSEKNSAPSLNARMVIDIINRESSVLNTQANLWLGYNAINEVLHDKLKKTFTQQAELDNKIFNSLVLS